MDKNGIPCSRYMNALMMIVLLLAGSSFILTDGDSRSSSRIEMPFDRDIDGLDDRISGGSEFPVWTFIHHGKGRSAGVLDHLEDSGVKVHSAYDIIPVVSVRFDSLSQIEAFLEMDRISSIELQGEISLHQDISVGSIRASRSSEYSPSTAQDLGMSGAGVTIAIIDTGVDNEHVTFNDAFVAGVDLTVPSSPLTPRDGTYDPDDRTGHGTAVASIALGRGDSEGVMRGVAPGAGLIDIKVVGNLPVSLNQNSVMDSMQWCSDNMGTSWGSGYEGIDIVSISLGIGDGSVAVTDAMDTLVEQGVVLVQGAGNSGSSYSSGPGTTWSDLSIVVGGVDDQNTIVRDDDEYWSSSTTGPRTDDGDTDPYDELRPDVVAPGVGIKFASSSRTSLIQPASGWSEGSGTSYATPHMAGTAALMLQARPSIAPVNGQNILRRIIHQTSEPVGDPYDSELSSSYNVRYGFGMLDAFSAVRGALSFTGTNSRPEITFFEASPNQTTPGGVCRIRVVAVDVDEEPLEYDLTADDGEISGDAPLWDWTAPRETGKFYFNLVVSDPSGGTATAKTSVVVVEGKPNRPPVITSFRSNEDTVIVGGTTTLTVVAIDQDGDPLVFDYSARMGTVTGQGDNVQYNAPDDPMTDTVTVSVVDGNGGSDTADLEIEVVEGSVNRAPSVTIVNAEPNVINANTSGLDKKLFALVADPDGPDDIDRVTADLSSIYGASDTPMKNDGDYPDDDPDDLWFSLLLEDLQGLENGVYTLKVTVYDMQGDSDTGMTQLEINMTETKGDVEIGRDTGPNPVLLGVGIVIALLFVMGIAAFFVMRGRSSRKQTLPPPAYGVQYPQQGPPGARFPPPQGGYYSPPRR